MKYVLVNWKMFPGVDDSVALLETIQGPLRERIDAGADVPRVIVCPSFLAITRVGAVVDGAVVSLGAQNCHWESEGPYTGEISARMLAGLVEYVMLGHSERRRVGDTDDQIARKVEAAVDAGLVPILLAGEDEQGSDYLQVTEHRLRAGLSRIDPATQPFQIVYEPSWAIGAEKTAPPEHVRRAVEHVRSVLDGLGARRPIVLYGGAVGEHNLEELAALDVLDGLGATRASLDPARFFKIVDALSG